MKRQCLSCPSGTLFGRDYCWQCKQLREREQAKAKRHREATRTMEPRDFPPHIIDALYLRAVWAKNPRKAQALKGRAA